MTRFEEILAALEVSEKLLIITKDENNRPSMALFQKGYSESVQALTALVVEFEEYEANYECRKFLDFTAHIAAQKPTLDLACPYTSDQHTLMGDYFVKRDKLSEISLQRGLTPKRISEKLAHGLRIYYAKILSPHKKNR